MSKIKEIKGREILDSCGNPTVEVIIRSDDGFFSCASVPTGVSTGELGALELRDRDPRRYHGMGVLRAIENIEKKISPAILGMDVFDQKGIDETMISLDGSDNKMNLGANAVFSVSLAVSRLAAKVKGLELYAYLGESFDFGAPSLPTPCFNMFNGGKYADTNLDFQEFMIVPLGKKTVSEKVRMGSEIFCELAKVLRKGGFDTDVGSEGGYSPDISSSVQAIEFMLSASINAGYKPKIDVGVGIDIGSSELFDSYKNSYIFKLDRAVFSSKTLIGLYNEWLKDFPIVFLEDGLSYDDWSSWSELTSELGGKIMVVGDDVFSSDQSRLRKGLKEKAGNSIVVKPSQAGTVTETMDCVKLAKRHNYKIVISHSYGETNDDFIADLSVAVGADFIKAGSLSRGERVSKYNRLMEIERIMKIKI